MSRNEESRRQFVHWAGWKKAGGRVDQDPQAAEIDDLIAGMPTPLKQTLAQVYCKAVGQTSGPLRTILTTGWFGGSVRPTGCCTIN